jgi:hypothetical protein
LVLFWGEQKKNKPRGRGQKRKLDCIKPWFRKKHYKISFKGGYGDEPFGVLGEGFIPPAPIKGGERPYRFLMGSKKGLNPFSGFNPFGVCLADYFLR